MTSLEASDLAARILGTFQGPSIRDWEEELVHLNAGVAGTTYVRLRREHEQRWLSIAVFMQLYRSLNTVDAGNRPEPCEYCSDHGWVDAGTYEWREVPYSAAEPCVCKAGKAASMSAVWRDAPKRDLTRV